MICQIEHYFAEEDYASILDKLEYDTGELKEHFSGMGRTVLSLLYYMITTLTTVGFGDIRPYTSVERIVITILLMFGIGVFSLFMGYIKYYIEEYMRLIQDLGDGDSLNSFFEVIKRYNNNQSLDPDFIKRIEEFFEYKWSFDRNQAIDEVDELALLF